MKDLDARELAALVDRLDAGLGATARGFHRNAGLVGALFVGIATIAFAREMVAEAIVSLCLGAAIVALGLFAARRNQPERMRPVLDAVRDRPELVLTVKHSTTSDSRQMFVTHWINIGTANAHLLLRANDDWNQLLQQLSRRCPTAAVDRG